MVAMGLAAAHHSQELSIGTADTVLQPRPCSGRSVMSRRQQVPTEQCRVSQPRCCCSPTETTGWPAADADARHGYANAADSTAGTRDGCVGRRRPSCRVASADGRQQRVSRPGDFADVIGARTHGEHGWGSISRACNVGPRRVDLGRRRTRTDRASGREHRVRTLMHCGPPGATKWSAVVRPTGHWQDIDRALSQRSSTGANSAAGRRSGPWRARRSVSIGASVGAGNGRARRRRSGRGGKDVPIMARIS